MKDLLGLLFSLFFGFAPALFFAWIVYWLDRYEKEPGILLGGVFVWGAVIAAGAAFMLNTSLGLGVYLFTKSEAATQLATGWFIAPFVEEILKGFAVLVIFLVFRSEFDSLLDGVVYAAIVALGFAATENTYYIYTQGYQEAGFSGIFWLVFVRVILVGWQHPFYTAFTGLGLAANRLSRNKSVKIAFPIIGLLAAITAHGLHNTLVSLLSGGRGLMLGTLIDWSGWLLMLVFIIWAIARERAWIVNQLGEEVSLGLITAAQYRTACSAWAQNLARLGALFSGKYTATNHFYQTCAELAYKKQQLADLGEENGNKLAIERLRADLARWSSRVVT
jgi:RsiW-degrading membrane proteinase PrsW (M82 family)